MYKSLIILCVNVQQSLAAVCKMNPQLNYEDYVNEQELNYVHFEWVKNYSSGHICYYFCTSEFNSLAEKDQRLG